jgi:microsomal dipeptidase-like Zn-dependent dipeptidase
MIGTEFDDSFVTTETLHDRDSICDFRRVPDLLRKRAYKEAGSEGILCGNWVRFSPRRGR